MAQASSVHRPAVNLRRVHTGLYSTVHSTPPTPYFLAGSGARESRAGKARRKGGEEVGEERKIASGPCWLFTTHILAPRWPVLVRDVSYLTAVTAASNYAALAAACIPTHDHLPAHTDQISREAGRAVRLQAQERRSIHCDARKITPPAKPPSPPPPPLTSFPMPLSPPLAMRYASRASIMRTLLVLVAAAGVVGQRHGTAKAFGPEQHVLSTERYAGGGSADYRAGSDASAEFTLQSNAELMGKTSARTDEGLFAASRAARKVAIIGGGAGGSSAAYFLSRAHEKLEAGGRGGEGFDITLLERDERIGGRAAVVHPYDDPQYPAVELGASIFADVNKNMQRAVKVCE